MVLAGSIGYVASERASRLAKIVQQTEVALGGARTAIKAGDLTPRPPAQQRNGEAYLGYRPRNTAQR